MSTPNRHSHPNCRCQHSVVLHNLSPSTGRRTGCSISDGEKATPCPCKAFVEAAAEPDDGALFPAPAQTPQGGQHL